jgi:hypothetical protein
LVQRVGLQELRSEEAGEAVLAEVELSQIKLAEAIFESMAV